MSNLDNDEKIVWGVMACLILLIVGIVFLAIRQDAAAQRDCAKRGGQWVVVGHHYQPPTYIVPQNGGVAIPVGGGEVNDYGCTR